MYDALKARNASRFALCHTTRTYTNAAYMEAHKALYIGALARLEMPDSLWPVVACIHLREADLDWNTQLAQGDPLNRVSVHVPRGQGPYTGPDAWSRAAAQALSDEGIQSWGDWTPGGYTTFWERYNGLGYANMGRPSPYVWAGTNQYISGKYVADGEYSSSAIDMQPGCVEVLLWLAENDLTINIHDLSKPAPAPLVA
jgi:lysozyme family protein